MPPISLLLLTFIVAFVVTGVDLVTSKYPGYFFLLRKARYLYCYCLLYGALSMVALYVLHHLIKSKYLKFEDWLSYPWLQAILVGVFVKAFLHVRLFTIKETPIGIETFVQTFEPGILRGLDLEKHNALQQFLAPRVAVHNDLESVKSKIVDDIPSDFTHEEKILFQKDVEDCKSVKEAMERYLKRFGKSNFDRLFPSRAIVKTPK